MYSVPIEIWKEVFAKSEIERMNETGSGCVNCCNCKKYVKFQNLKQHKKSKKCIKTDRRYYLLDIYEKMYNVFGELTKETEEQYYKNIFFRNVLSYCKVMIERKYNENPDRYKEIHDDFIMFMNYIVFEYKNESDYDYQQHLMSNDEIKLDSMVEWFENHFGKIF